MAQRDVTVSPNNINDTTVTITQRGTYAFKLTADDGVAQSFDTVQIIVGAMPAMHRT